MRTSSTLRSTVLLAAVTAAGIGAIVAATPSTHAEPDARTSSAAAVPAGRTALTFAVDDCDGCRIQLHQGFAGKRPVLWESEERSVEDGAVTFVVASSRTWGMTATVDAPWEGHTGYRTTVAFRYDGRSVGDPVTLEEARTAEAASGCWAGTRQREVTIPLVVEQVEVDGVHHRVPGSIAYTSTTEDWASDVRTAVEGVLGSQDVDLCGQA